jgi:hypothetical protein
MLKLFFGALGRELRAVAEGKRGPGWQRAYQNAQGWKTVTGALLACAVVVMVYLNALGPAEWVGGTLAALLLSAGLLDKAWRQPPTAITQSSAFRLAREHLADIGLMCTAAAAALATCSGDTSALLSHLHLTCSSATMLLGCMVSVLAWLGLEVRSAAPPVAR